MVAITQLSLTATPGERYSLVAKARESVELMSLYVNPKFMAFDDNGDPLVAGSLHTYYAGTTTPKTTYSDVDLSEANANPIILDSRGEAPLSIYGHATYKFVLKDANNVEIWTMDNVAGMGCCTKVLEFDDDDLDANGDLTISHPFEASWLRVAVYDEDGRWIIPEYVESTETDSLVIGFGNMTLSGTWKVRYGI